ncbi:hypothetical protein BKA62DRAFT_93353 [Auriculariales sp. MPI-PUGE-AT-0066]|nr:hypothetical protein BKA62DRAFT_93353 [Auriculariales sp. MPI-PUGE-AT-0066]
MPDATDITHLPTETLADILRFAAHEDLLRSRLISWSWRRAVRFDARFYLRASVKPQWIGNSDGSYHSDPARVREIAMYACLHNLPLGLTFDTSTSEPLIDEAFRAWGGRAIAAWQDLQELLAPLQDPTGSPVWSRITHLKLVLLDQLCPAGSPGSRFDLLGTLGQSLSALCSVEILRVSRPFLLNTIVNGEYPQPASLNTAPWQNCRNLQSVLLQNFVFSPPFEGVPVFPMVISFDLTITDYVSVPQIPTRLSVHFPKLRHLTIQPIPHSFRHSAGNSSGYSRYGIDWYDLESELLQQLLSIEVVDELGFYTESAVPPNLLCAVSKARFRLRRSYELDNQTNFLSTVQPLSADGNSHPLEVYAVQTDEPVVVVAKHQLIDRIRIISANRSYNPASTAIELLRIVKHLRGCIHLAKLTMDMGTVLSEYDALGPCLWECSRFPQLQQLNVLLYNNTLAMSQVDDLAYQFYGDSDNGPGTNQSHDEEASFPQLQVLEFHGMRSRRIMTQISYNGC